MSKRILGKSEIIKTKDKLSLHLLNTMAELITMGRSLNHDLKLNQKWAQTILFQLQTIYESGYYDEPLFEEMIDATKHFIDHYFLDGDDDEDSRNWRSHRFYDVEFEYKGDKTPDITHKVLPSIADYKYKSNREEWFHKYYGVSEEIFTEEMYERRKIDINNYTKVDNNG